jgi:hypothetical protein
MSPTTNDCNWSGRASRCPTPCNKLPHFANRDGSTSLGSSTVPRKNLPVSPSNFSEMAVIIFANGTEIAASVVAHDDEDFNS